MTYAKHSVCDYEDNAKIFYHLNVVAVSSQVNTTRDDVAFIASPCSVRAPKKRVKKPNSSSENRCPFLFGLLSC